ncbi:hypothetical protein OD917_15055 [Flavobacterium sp. SH_e]|nr:hypothetical protein [Flavobacterium sp. SH_e]MCV2486254.1 hypothetical protein [Flavobacterium sp. SH_e]
MANQKSSIGGTYSLTTFKGCVVTDMLKLCILALEQDALKISETNKSKSINVDLILDTVLQLISMDEFEFLSEMTIY